MDDNELREMDAKVHMALYPEWRIEKREWRHGIDYRAILPGDGPNTWLKDIPLPWYTTDLADWEPIYALRPEWRWTFELVTDDEGQCAWDVYMAAPVIGAGHYRTYETPYIYEREARGWAAVALGMSRCVLQWAEAQHGG